MTKRTVLVTGGNKGIGKQICIDLAKTGLFHVILTARQQDLGTQATNEINATFPNSTTFLQVDVTNDASVNHLVQELEKQKIQVDILINNAGIAIKVPNLDEKVARDTLSVNYFGVVRMTEAMLPHLSKSQDARIITVSSVLGQLYGNASLAKEQYFANLVNKNETLSRQQLDAEANNFVTSAKEQTLEAQGWPKTAYRVSKMLVNQYNRYLATIVPSNVSVAVTHPGWIKTDCMYKNTV